MTGEGPVSAVHLDAIPVTASEGVTQWRAVRRHLGIESFGINAFQADTAGDPVIEDHTETSSGAAGHEELYLVQRGHARFTVEGSELDAPAGTLVFVRDPAARRGAVAVEPDTLVLAFGGTPGEPYVPSPWEYYAPAWALSQAGDHEGALRLVSDGLERYPERATLLYNMACYEALSGHADSAVDHLRKAVEIEPRMAEWASDDTDLDSIRDRPDYPA